jgi:serpin B
MGARLRTLSPIGIAIAIVVMAVLPGCGSTRPAEPPARTSPAASNPTPPAPTSPAASNPTPPPQTVPRADAAALRDGNARFAGRLLSTLAHSPQNVAVSPASISQAVSMAFAGARGATATQIAAALDFTLPPARLGAALHAVDTSLAGVNGPGATLNVANAMYGQSGLRFRQAFLRAIARDYGAGLRTADFARAAAAARAEINAWVSAQTKGKIPQLMGPGAVDELTRLVLVNAVYLHAKWLDPFSHGDTFPAPFHAPAGTVKVSTMHQTGVFGYVQGSGYQALELPYQGGRLAFDILLPSAGGYGSLISRLAGEGPLPLLAGLRHTQVALALPKFRLTTHVELAGALSSLGMPLAFDPGRADLSGIAGAPGYLYIHAVVHEAYLSVDEDGTEAAAATGVGITGTAEPLPPKTKLIVDRPFVFVLRDTKTGAVLFEGTVAHP